MYKFIVIGSSGVGKTALLRRLIDNEFVADTQSTIGVEFLTTTVQIDGTPVKLQLWDTAGQERFRSIAKTYFRSAIGVMLVFDLTNRRSFDECNEWLNDVHKLCDPNAVITLIANKSDLHEERVVTAADIETFANNHHLMYLETSALAGENVKEAFERTASAVYRKSVTNREGQKPETALEKASEKKECC